MKLENVGDKPVFLGGGSKLLPGETHVCKKKDGEFLLRNPNLKEVKKDNGKTD